MIIKDLKLSDDNYKNIETKKTQIVLHHTVSAGTAESVRNWWESDKTCVAVSYIIDKKGDIYRLFDDKFWSWHIGKGSHQHHNESSIGIEIINEGPITNKDGNYYWFNNRQKYTGGIFHLTTPWRNETAFAVYTQEQFNSTLELVQDIIKRHSINTKVLIDYKYDPTYLEFQGIVSHHNLRSDKTDVSPAFDLIKFNKILNAKN